MRALTLILCLAAGPAMACERPVEPAVAVARAGPASLALDSGRTVRLADIRPLADMPDAIAFPAEVTVHRAAEATDRYGRVVGDIVLDATGESLSEQLLRGGLALVDPLAMSGPCLDALFAQEREAEAAGRGIWADPPVRSAADPSLAELAGQYLIVEGVVKSVGETQRTLYLNFGDNYRTDFTALVRRSDARGWADSLPALKGKTVRIRGVVDAWNGAMILVEHPAQVEGFSP